MERDLGLAGAQWFYAAFALSGACILYFILPETEGRTLEDIERHFADKGHHFMDRKIKVYEPVGTKEVNDLDNGVYRRSDKQIN